MLRTRKNKRYNEQTNDDDGGDRRFDIHEKIKSDRFQQTKDEHLIELTGDAMTLKLIQKNGFERPVLVERPNGLGLKVPPKSFMVRNVRDCVGYERVIDVMDVKTQKNIEMSMKDWCKYYESRSRSRLLNVISLEFSHTELDSLVESPDIVKQLDWVDLVWPKFLKNSQTESTNKIDDMKYPKVQKYCLMSVRGSYTDFHIDFGGTSVWYHILKGKKIFWMIPPTELNLQTFEEWTLSGLQQEVFFGELVEECFRVELGAGNTFFIPSGWIHAVYTKEDSLVFGGNFLHSYGIENQLRVSRVEDATKVPVKFRYPFYTEILWYVVQHYVYCLTGKDHLHPREQSKFITPAKQPVIAGIEEESTESEHDDSDIKSQKRRKTSVSKGGSRKRPPTKRGSKKGASKKVTSEDDQEDSSTEIDSDSDTTKPVDKTATTCRMTKNSLLRLQYEVDDQVPQRTSKSQPSSTTTSNSSPSSKGSNPKNSPIKKLRIETTSKEEGIKTTKANELKPPKPGRQSEESPEINRPTDSPTRQGDQQLTTTPNGWSKSSAAAFSSISIWSKRTESHPEPVVQVDEQEDQPKVQEQQRQQQPDKIHLTKYEVEGLRALVKYLSKLSGAKKHLPSLIRNSRALLDDCKKIIAEHEHDNPELAVTGEPITSALIRKTVSLVTQIEAANIEAGDKVKLESTTSAPITTSPQKARSESKAASEISSIFKTLIDETSRKSTLPTSNDCSDNQLSPSKETKCLTTNKKRSFSTTTPAIVSSNAPYSSPSGAQTGASAEGGVTPGPPPRVKSPPTRPLSNNQYTTKTKNTSSSSSNLLLPGSFADLIAATSTDKKVFDVDVSSALFAPPKDLASPAEKCSVSPNNKVASRTSNILEITGGVLLSPTPKSVPKVCPPDAGSPVPRQPNQRANSPEPPKLSPQKRIIYPNAKPQNKEKLIFASAPYQSPVFASEQNRGGLYPWQSSGPPPTHHQHLAQGPPTGPSSGPAYLGPPGQRNPPAGQIETESIYDANTRPNQPSPFVKPVLRQDDHHHRPTEQHRQQHQDNQFKQPHLQPQPTQTAPSEMLSQVGKHPSKTFSSINNNGGTNFTSSTANNHGTVSPVSHVAPHQQSSNTRMPDTSLIVEAKDFSVDQKPSLTQTEEKQKAEPPKKPNKPRGPPKKSKEAREAIESDLSVKTSIPMPVIKAGPLTSTGITVSGVGSVPVTLASIGPGGLVVPIIRTQPMITPISKAQEAAKPANPTIDQSETKSKSSKKSKKKAQNVATSSSVPALNNMTQHMAPVTSSVSIRPLQQQSVICSLVTPPQGLNQGVGGAKLSPQSYLISRPLLLNTVPTVTTSLPGANGQLGASGPRLAHQVQRAPMPLLATSAGAGLAGYPLQQGARFVWATTAPPSSTVGVRPVASHLIATGPQVSLARHIVPMAHTTTATTIAAPPTTKAATIMAQASAAGSKQSTQNAHHNSSASARRDDSALISLATTALSTASMATTPSQTAAGNQHLQQRQQQQFTALRPYVPPAIMVSSASGVAHQQAALLAGQQLFRPLMQRLPMTHLMSAAAHGQPRQPLPAHTGPTAAATAAAFAAANSMAINRPPSTGQFVFARLPNQAPQQRYLITQPGFLPPGYPAPNLLATAAAAAAHQVPPHMAYAAAAAAYRPPVSQPPKAIKTKKVKTS